MERVHACPLLSRQHDEGTLFLPTKLAFKPINYHAVFGSDLLRTMVLCHLSGFSHKMNVESFVLFISGIGCMDLWTAQEASWYSRLDSS